MAVATTNSASDNIAPPSQSMDKPPSTNTAVATSGGNESPSAVQGSSSAVTADPVDSSTSSPKPNRLLEFQPSLRSEEYRQLFRLPPEEVLIQDFNCALQENFILQGHMYLFVHHICFYSNLFGFETKKIIAFDEITSVNRAKTAGIFPTAIELTASDKKYFFTSFLSRDEAFKLINDGWVEHGNGSKAVSDQQESRSELIDEEPEIVVAEDSDETRLLRDDFETINTNTNVDPPEQPNGSAVEAEVPVTSSRVQDDVDEDTIIVQNTDCSSSGVTLAWEVEDADAPNVPEGYTLAAESTFPIKVDEFFNLFFSDAALPFLESYHKKCGDKDLVCTSWKPHDQPGYAREVSFQHPIKIYFGAKFGSCNEVQSFRVYRNSHLVVKTSQVISDVPYGDYFSVEGLWDVVPNSNDGCTLRVYVDVAFSKRTMWKGKIVQATIEECRETFAAFIELANALLKRKSIDKQANVIPEVNVEAQVRTPDQSVTPPQLRTPDMTTTHTVPQSQETIHVSTPLQTFSSVSAAAASFFKDSIRKLFSSIKSQNQVQAFVVILLAIVILLMQISIVVLLLRPQTVQVVSDTAWMSTNRINRRAETVTLLNKQIDHLKEEMLIVETVLEKMRHEHDMLSVQLKKLMLQKT
ncbi:protein VASCULAR ASSOCIATED DEATH 1, chloroplastic [Rutidosis leptorrhynchoides]|uniref:protein VASCULAR ASSOCIATED DEATH 1, chloroplastic n=1 Tax=Rutidosis leptorrhynchoides TaxID=125765 RepID=UPI003A99FC98